MLFYSKANLRTSNSTIRTNLCKIFLPNVGTISILYRKLEEKEENCKILCVVFHTWIGLVSLWWAVMNIHSVVNLDWNSSSSTTAVISNQSKSNPPQTFPFYLPPIPSLFINFGDIYTQTKVLGTGNIHLICWSSKISWNTFVRPRQKN